MLCSTGIERSRRRQLLYVGSACGGAYRRGATRRGGGGGGCGIVATIEGSELCITGSQCQRPEVNSRAYHEGDDHDGGEGTVGMGMVGRLAYDLLVSKSQ